MPLLRRIMLSSSMNCQGEMVNTLDNNHVLFLITPMSNLEGVNTTLSICGILPLAYLCVFSLSLWTTIYVHSTNSYYQINRHILQPGRPIDLGHGTFSPKTRKTLCQIQWNGHWFTDNKCNYTCKKIKVNQTLQLAKYWPYKPKRSILYNGQVLCSWTTLPAQGSSLNLPFYHLPLIKKTSFLLPTSFGVGVGGGSGRMRGVGRPWSHYVAQAGLELLEVAIPYLNFSAAGL